MFLLHYLINDIVFGGERGDVLEIKFVFYFSLQILSKIFLIIRRTHRVVFIHVRVFSQQMGVLLAIFKQNLNFVE